MKKQKVKWIDRDLVASSCYIGLCQSEKSFHKELKRLSIPERKWPEWVSKGADACVQHIYKVDGSGDVLFVCVGDCTKRKPSEIVGILIHEAVHVWQSIRKDMGEKKPSKEFEAYSIQNIAQKLIVSYKTKRKGKGNESVGKRKK